MTTVSADPTALAAAVASRICHDVISPVGALINVIELLEEGGPVDAEMLGLLKDSAEAARAKLEYLRLAFGAASTLGEEADAAHLKNAAEALFRGGRIRFHWQGGAGTAPKARLRMMALVILCAADGLPRGGDLTAEADAGLARIAVRARDPRAAFREETLAALEGREHPNHTPGRHAHVEAARALGSALGGRLTWTAAEGEVAIQFFCT